MKRYIRRIGALLVCLAVFLSSIATNTIAAKNEETKKTTFPIQVIHKTGDDKENFVMVLMGDGYTENQQDKFLEDAKKKAQGMLQWSPYKEYSDRINIYAVQTISNESGVSVYGGESADTYFHVRVFGKAAGFSNGGDERAKALRQEIEEKYLDQGANVGTIHVISNTDGSYGASVNSLFSFSSNSGDNQNGMVMAHEIAHSIGGLGDEYERYTNKPNTSDTSNSDTIKWSKLLGFRGVGITMAGTETAFAPSRECMMRWVGQPFCEVCKMELARKLNNPDYVSRPAEIYVANPEVSIPHSKTGTLDQDSEKYRITEKNITKANDDDLEFRTVVQNLANKERHLRLSFQITGADGTTVKYQASKDYTIPALSNWYSPDDARASLSLVLYDVYDLSHGDRLDGRVIDMDTGEILATDKTANQAWSTVNLHYQIKNEDGTCAEIPCAQTAIVYVPRNTSYLLRNPELAGYTYVGNSVEQKELPVTDENEEIIYYYQAKKYEAEATPTPTLVPTATPTVSPTTAPTATPTVTPTAAPTTVPTATPTATASTVTPTATVTTAPKAMPTIVPPAAPPATPPVIPAKKQKKKKTVKDIIVVVKPRIKKNPSNVSEVIKKAVKKVLKKADKKGRKIIVKIKTKPKKKATLKIDKSTMRFLVANKIKKLQWDNGRKSVKMSLKTLKKVGAFFIVKRGV